MLSDTKRKLDTSISPVRVADPLDPQDFGRPALVATGGGQHLADLLRFGIGESFNGTAEGIYAVDCLRGARRRDR
jgi:hypothetical protein